MSQTSTLSHEEFMGFVLDDASYNILRSIAEREGWPTATVQTGGLDALSELLSEATPPRIAVVDIDNHPDPVAAISRLNTLTGGQMQLLLIGTTNDVALYRRLLQAGAQDYLPKPISAEVMAEAIRTIQSQPVVQNTDTPKAAKLMLVVGTRGGVGASSFALNLAWLMAEEQQQHVALIDLDLHFGGDSLALDQEPGRGLREALETPSRMDSLLIASAMVNVTPHLSILGAEESLEEAILFDSAATTALMRELKSNFSFVIMDMPRAMLPAQKRLVAQADVIVLVSDYSLISVRDINRIKKMLKSLSCPASLLLVINGMGDEKHQQLDAAAFERGIQGKADLLLPSDAPNMKIAANNGKPLAQVNSASPLILPIRDLAAKLTGNIKNKEEEHKKWWQGFLAGKKTSKANEQKDSQQKDRPK